MFILRQNLRLKQCAFVCNTMYHDCISNKGALFQSKSSSQYKYGYLSRFISIFNKAVWFICLIKFSLSSFSGGPMQQVLVLLMDIIFFLGGPYTSLLVLQKPRITSPPLRKFKLQKVYIETFKLQKKKKLKKLRKRKI